MFAGAAAAAGLTLLERRRSMLGRATVACSAIELAVVVAAIWAFEDDDDDVLVRAGWTAIVALAALLVATVATLQSQTPATLRLSQAAGVTTALGAAVTVVLVYRDNGDGWQAATVLWIVGLLCAALVPIVERLRRSTAPLGENERIVATLDGVEVIARRGAGPGTVSISLEPGEQLVLRRRVP